jgi:hypothetical protein
MKRTLFLFLFLFLRWLFLLSGRGSHAVLDFLQGAFE